MVLRREIVAAAVSGHSLSFCSVSVCSNVSSENGGPAGSSKQLDGGSGRRRRDQETYCVFVIQFCSSGKCENATRLLVVYSFCLPSAPLVLCAHLLARLSSCLSVPSIQAFFLHCMVKRSLITVRTLLFRFFLCVCLFCWRCAVVSRSCETECAHSRERTKVGLMMYRSSNGLMVEQKVSGQSWCLSLVLLQLLLRLPSFKSLPTFTRFCTKISTNHPSAPSLSFPSLGV
mmetsp:Transcript_43904/g.86644  ORF Transcript_43904/g.86644 Transcript_43904/m.86644 type:complete len:230 (-) Transcript_43904:1011-1700(-)